MLLFGDFDATLRGVVIHQFPARRLVIVVM